MRQSPLVLRNLKAVAVHIQRESVQAPIVRARPDALQEGAARVFDERQSSGDVVGFDGEMRRRFVLPAVISVARVGLPEVQLVRPELHPRDAPA